jgi:hypothetical protein
MRQVNRREVRHFPSLAAAIEYAAQLNRCIWVQVTGRAALYKVYPGGRCIHHPLPESWKKIAPGEDEELIEWCNQQTV